MIRHKTLAYVHADLRRTLTGSGIEAERQRGREGRSEEVAHGRIAIRCHVNDVDDGQNDLDYH
jgi:hypothetical protein